MDTIGSTVNLKRVLTDSAIKKCALFVIKWMVSEPVVRYIGIIDDIYWRRCAEILLKRMDDAKAVRIENEAYHLDLDSDRYSEIIDSTFNELYATKIIGRNDWVISEDVILKTQELFTAMIAVANADKNRGTFQGLNPELDTGMQSWSTKGPIK